MTKFHKFDIRVISLIFICQFIKLILFTYVLADFNDNSNTLTLLNLLVKLVEIIYFKLHICFA